MEKNRDLSSSNSFFCQYSFINYLAIAVAFGLHEWLKREVLIATPYEKQFVEKILQIFRIFSAFSVSFSNLSISDLNFLWKSKWHLCAQLLNWLVLVLSLDWNIQAKSWEPFRTCFLNSKAIPAQFWWKWFWIDCVI